MFHYEKTRAQLQQGFTCDACGHAIPGTNLYAVTCPNCRVPYQTSTQTSTQPGAGQVKK